MSLVVAGRRIEARDRVELNLWKIHCILHPVRRSEIAAGRMENGEGFERRKIKTL